MVIQNSLSSSCWTDHQTLIWCRFVYHDAYHIFGINAFEWIIFSLRVEDSTTYLPPSVHISFSVLDNKTSVEHLSHLPKVYLLINERADEDCSFSQRLRKCIANKQGWIKSSLPGIFIPNSFRTVRTIHGNCLDGSETVRISGFLTYHCIGWVWLLVARIYSGIFEEKSPYNNRIFVILCRFKALLSCLENRSIMLWMCTK